MIENSLTVLVVEDIEDHLYLTRMLLEQCGCRVVESKDGGQAVMLAERERPDMILMDIGLPGVDGYEATRRIRQIPEMRDTPILAYTAYDTPETARRAIAAGFTDYITKPVTFEKMRELVMHYLPEKT